MADNFSPSGNDLDSPQLFDILAVIEKQGNDMLKNGANKDVVDQLVMDRGKQIVAAWNTYGPQAFTPKKAPDTIESLDNTKPAANYGAMDQVENAKPLGKDEDPLGDLVAASPGLLATNWNNLKQAGLGAKQRLLDDFSQAFPVPQGPAEALAMSPQYLAKDASDSNLQAIQQNAGDIEAQNSGLEAAYQKNPGLLSGVSYYAQKAAGDAGPVAAMMGASLINPALGVGVAGGLSDAQQYAAKRAEGASPDEAATSADISGVGGAVGAVLPAHILASPFDRYLAKAGALAAGNELSSTAIAPAELAAQNYAEGKDTSATSLTDAAKQAAKEALFPSLALGGFGGLFKSHPRDKVPDTNPLPPITGDTDIDDGLNVGKQTAKDAGLIYSGSPENAPAPSTTLPMAKDFDVTAKGRNNAGTITNADVTVGDLNESKPSQEDAAWTGKAEDEKAVRDLIPDIFDSLDGVEKSPSRSPEPTNTVLDTPEMRDLRNQLQKQRAEANAAMPDPGAEVTTEPGPLDKTRTIKYPSQKQTMPDLDLSGETPHPAEEDDEESPTTRDARRQRLLEPTSPTGLPAGSSEAYPSDLGILRNGDGSITIPKEVARTRTPDEVAPVTASAADRAQRQPAHDMINKLGTADKVLAAIGKGTDALSALARRVLASNDVSGTKVEAVNPEDLTKTKDGLHHALLPNKGTVFGLQQGNRIALRGAGFVRNGLNKMTIVHEIIHSAVRDKINAVLQGKSTSKPVIQAVHELDHIRQTLKANRPDLADSTKPMAHALENVHEFHAVLSTDPIARAQLDGIKLGHVTAWAKVKSIFAKILGTSAMDKPVLDRILELNNRIIDHNPAEEGKHDFLGERAAPRDQALASSSGSDKEKAGYKPIVTDRLSGWQKAKSYAVPVIQRLGLNYTNAPGRIIRAANENAASATDAGRIKADEIANNLAKSMKAENVPHAAIQSYLEKSNPRALDNYPKTKAAADSFDAQRQAHRDALVKLIASNPNATNKQLDFAENIKENPGYLNRKYSNEGFTAGLMRTARNAEAVLAKNSQAALTSAQKNAIKVVNDTRDWIRRTLLPEADMSNRSMQGIRTMAKGLGIDVPTVLDGVKASDKRGVLEAEIRKAVPDWQHAQVAEDRLLNEVAGISGNKSNVVASYYRGARVGDLFTERSRVPPELRKLWGEVEEPASEVANTLIKQSMGIAHLQQQNAIREGLMKGGMLHTSKTDAPKGFDTPLRGTKYGPLRNMWTAPEIEEMLKSHVELSTAASNIRTAIWSGNAPLDVAKYATSKFLNGMGRAITGFKMYTMALSPRYWIMYGAGGPSILATHGIVDPRYPARGFAAHVAELSPGTLAAMPEGLRNQTKADLDLIRKYGFNEPNATGEVFQRLQQRALAEDLAKGGEANWAQSLKRTMGAVLSMPTKIGMHALSLADGYAKRAAFLHRIDYLTDKNERRGTGKSLDDIHKEAADWVKDTTINYGRAPILARMTERLGGSNGLVYVTETVRNAFNAMHHGALDFKDGLENKDPISMLHGAKQMMGTGFAVTGMSAVIAKAFGVGLSIAGMSSTPIGQDDKRNKMLQQEGSRFSGQNTEQLSDPDSKNSYLWTPGDTNTYYYQVQEAYNVISNALHAHANGEKVDAGQVAKQAFGAFAGTIFRSALMINLKNVLDHELPGWMADTPELTDKESQYFKNTFHLSDNGVKSAIALTDMGRPGILKAFDKADESSASEPVKNMMRAGLGVTQVPNDAGFTGKTANILKGQLDSAKLDLDKTLKSTYEFDESALGDSYKNAFKDTYKVLTNMKQDMDYAEASGLSKEQIIQHMALGKIPEDAIAQVYSGKMNPAQMLFTDLSSKLEDEVQKHMDDPAKQQQLIKIYSTRMKQLVSLTKQYMTMTPDQIEELH